MYGRCQFDNRADDVRPFGKAQWILYSVSPHPLQETKSEQDLADLAPWGRLVAISAAKGAIVEDGKRQGTARDQGIGIARYFVSAIKIGSRDVTDGTTTVADGLKSEPQVLRPVIELVTMIGSVLG